MKYMTLKTKVNVQGYARKCKGPRHKKNMFTLEMQLA